MTTVLIERPAAAVAAQPADAVGAALAEVSASNLRLTELAALARGLHATFKDVAFDVSTTKGMDEAKRARMQLRTEARFPMQKLQEAGSKMLGQMQRQFNARAGELIAEVESYEKPIDEQIKAEEDRKAAEKAERDRKEREAAAAIQTRIDLIRSFAVIPAGVKAAGIQVAIDNLTATDVTLEAYGNRAGEASVAKDETLHKLAEMHAAAVAHEAEVARLEVERAELARQRAEAEAAAQAERDRIAAEQRAQAERLAAERAAFEAEQAAARAEAQRREEADRARRDEEDRMAREARAAEERRIAEARAALEAEQRAVREVEEARLAAARKAEQDAEDARAAAERKRLDEEAAAQRAEEQRIADEASAQQRREYFAEVAAEQAQERKRNAAGAMFDALRQWRNAEQTGDGDQLACARAARDEVLTHLEQA